MITSASIGGKKLNFNHPPPIRPILISKTKIKIATVKNGFLTDFISNGLYLFLMKFFKVVSIFD